MKRILFNIISLFLMSLPFVVSCTEDKVSPADLLLKQAAEQCDSGNYDSALALIDSLRLKYPGAIEARKKALVLYSEASEKQAESRISDINAELQEIEQQYSEMSKVVTDHKRKGVATSEELTAFTKLRMHRDSVQTKFDAECEKIKFIRKKRELDINK